jgi:hypothetical protein
MQRRRLSLIVLAVAAAILAGWWWLRSQPEPAPVVYVNELPASKSSAEPSYELPVERLTAREPLSQSNAVDDDGSSLLVVAAVHEGIRLYGFVRAGNGDEALVPSVDIILTDQLGTVQRTSPDAKCRYSFTGLSPGRHWIVCGAGEWGRIQRIIELDASPRDRRLDLQLEFGFELTVEVVDPANQSLPKLPLAALVTIEAPGELLDAEADTVLRNSPFATWKPELHGPDSEPAVVLGTLSVKHPLPLYVSLLHRDRVIATQKVAAGATSVRFVIDPDDRRLQPGSFRLRLVDAESRQPLPRVDATVMVSFDTHRDKTSDEGTLSGPIGSGWLSLTVRHPGYERSEFSARLEPGVMNDLGDVPLAKERFVAGIFVDEHGSGVRGMLETFVLDSKLPESSFRPRISTQNSEDGTFRIGGLSQRRYLLILHTNVAQRSQSCAFGVDLREGSLENLRLELGPTTPLTVRPSNDEWPQVAFDIIDERGFPVVSSRLFGPEPRAIQLMRGRYEVEVRVGGAVVGARRILNVANDPITLALP